MRKIFTSAFCAALLLAAALVAGAQEPRLHHRMGAPDDMARHEEFMAKALDLTEAQQAAAKKIHEDVAAKAKPLMEQQGQQWEQIHALLDSDNPDATELGQRMIAAHATGQQLKALHEDAMAKFKTLLNADQVEKLEKFEAMHREHEGSGFRRGPGF